MPAQRRVHHPDPSFHRPPTTHAPHPLRLLLQDDRRGASANAPPSPFGRITALEDDVDDSDDGEYTLTTYVGMSGEAGIFYLRLSPT